jgi:hypothetical protein
MFCHLSHASSPFFLYFGDRVSLFAQAGLHQNPPVLGILYYVGWYAPAGHRPSYCSRCLSNSWWTLCQVWPGTEILLISASQVASISGMSHWYLAYLFIYLRVKAYLHYPGWPWIHNLPASASWVLGLQVHTIGSIYLLLNDIYIYFSIP